MSQNSYNVISGQKSVSKRAAKHTCYPSLVSDRRKLLLIAIVENLLKKRNHLRGISHDLQINQMSTSRKLQDLHNENVVDYTREGKNKVFFLKKTLEAKQFACLVELHKQIDIIKKYPKLRLIFEKIKQHPQITLSLLFGSYAKKAATKNGDIDVYIDTQDRNVKRDIEFIDMKLRVKIGKYDKQNLLIKEIEKNHVVIKGVEEYYEKNQFFA